jgi:HTH-type transcriptional regulator/antitoxin HipB
MSIDLKMTPESIGQAVRAQRKRLRMNQSDLAMVSGTGVRFISDLENGKESCELGKTLQVLKNLGIQMNMTAQGEI